MTEATAPWFLPTQLWSSSPSSSGEGAVFPARYTQAAITARKKEVWFVGTAEDGSRKITSGSSPVSSTFCLGLLKFCHSNFTLQNCAVFDARNTQTRIWRCFEEVSSILPFCTVSELCFQSPATCSISAALVTALSASGEGTFGGRKKKRHRKEETESQYSTVLG